MAAVQIELVRQRGAVVLQQDCRVQYSVAVTVELTVLTRKPNQLHCPLMMRRKSSDEAVSDIIND